MRKVSTIKGESVDDRGTLPSSERHEISLVRRASRAHRDTCSESRVKRVPRYYLPASFLSAGLLQGDGETERKEDENEALFIESAIFSSS